MAWVAVLQFGQELVTVLAQLVADHAAAPHRHRVLSEPGGEGGAVRFCHRFNRGGRCAEFANPRGG